MTTTQSEAQPDGGSALTVWNTHVQALTSAPEQAHAAITIIHDQLMPLYNAFAEKGNTKRADEVRQAYEMALGLYEQGQSYGAALAAGQTVITETAEQRDNAANELAQLLKAIDDGDESHPKLQGWAEDIRQDEYESAMYDEDDYYAEIFDDNVRANIDQSWEVVGMQGGLIYNALIGEFSLKKEHAQMLQRLISELPTDQTAYQAYNKAVLEEPDEDEDGDA
jgi:hypothetical protein